MKKKSSRRKATKLFDSISQKITKATGSSVAFISALAVIIIWLVTGPVFGFSDTWQLIINTGTTIVTFLMVFIIQHSQNKDTIAMQLKLNELIAANNMASNRLVNIEELTDEELNIIKQFYVRLAVLAKKDKDVFSTHSLDEAEDRHEDKMAAAKRREQD